jgi:hypothetical protein
MKRILLSIISAAIVFWCGAARWDAQAEEARAKDILIILNLKSDFDSGELGQKAGYSLRTKLRRSERFTMLDELDFDQLEDSGSARAGLAEEALAERLAAPFGAHFVVWGEVTKDTGYKISVRAVQLGSDEGARLIARSASDLREFALACGEIADELAKHFTGSGYRETYPSKSTEGYERVSANLVANGDFEKGENTPDNWEKVDGLCTFHETDGERGGHIRMDTDVYLSQWHQWRKRFEGGESASAAPAKDATSGDKYDTVGGTYGVRLYSDVIPVEAAATYSIEFDALCPFSNQLFFPKVFVKGYGKDGTTMEFYNMYKAVHTSDTARWQHYSRVFHPTDRTPQVTEMRVMLFAYWPPGEYAFDNVAIYKVQAATNK